MSYRPKLTAKQKAVVAFIRQFRAESGFPPTRREIATHFGWVSTNGAQQHLKLIAAKGYIHLGSSPRSIRLLDRRSVAH